MSASRAILAVTAALAISVSVVAAGVAPVRADNCSSPADCEQTAGYTTAIAVAGGAIAVGAAVIAGQLAGAIGAATAATGAPGPDGRTSGEVGQVGPEPHDVPTTTETIVVSGSGAIEELVSAGVPPITDASGNVIRDPNGNPYLQPPANLPVNGGYSTTTIVDPVSGAPITVIDPNGAAVIKEVQVPAIAGTTAAIYSGNAAINILEQAGLVRTVRGPDGTTTIRPTDNMEGLQSGSATVRVSEATDPAGRVVEVQDALIRSVSGVALTTDANGNITSATVVANQTPPGNSRGQPGQWDNVDTPRPGMQVQGDPAFVNQVRNDLNTLANGRTGQNLLNQLQASGQQTFIRQVNPGEGNSASYHRPADGRPRPDGTNGPGTAVTVGYDNTRNQIYDGSQPWHNRPPAVGLGHELIHVLHGQTGTRTPGRMQDPGNPGTPAAPNMIPGEDAATVGLGPFAGNAITENNIRAEQGLPPRPQY